MATRPAERFGPSRLATVLAEVCERAGLDHRGAELLRFTNNAVFSLASEPVVVRIVASRALRHRVGKVVSLARWLAEQHVPAVRLWHGLPQPVRIGEDLATVWWRVPESRGKPTPKDLARLLRRLHELPPPPFELPRWAPLDDVRRRLGDAEKLTDDDREFLENRCDDLQRELDELPFGGGERLVHGDAHLGNVIMGERGPLLCDFDSSCLGPIEADLTPLPVGVLRFGQPSRHYRQFSRVYGYDVTAWHGFRVLRDIRELKLTTSLLPTVRSNPTVAPELHRRMADLHRGDTSSRWARYR